MKRLGWMLLAGVLGCGPSVVVNRPPPYTLRVEPRSAVAPTRVAERAVRVYQDDLPRVDALGAEVVATIDVEGDTDSSGAESGIASKAAEAGGTHFFVIDGGAHQEMRVTPEAEEQARRSNFSRDWNCAFAKGYGQLACARPTVQAQASAVTVRHARVVVGRVEPERWAELPAPLRPTRSVSNP